MHKDYTNSNLLQVKSYEFALRIVRLFQHISTNKKENILSKQLLRSGTAIGALVSESKYAESKADFLHKLLIALKEANETNYWLHLLKDTDYISEKEFESIDKDSIEIINLLVSITKTIKSK